MPDTAHELVNECSASAVVRILAVINADTAACQRSLDMYAYIEMLSHLCVLASLCGLLTSTCTQEAASCAIACAQTSATWHLALGLCIDASQRIPSFSCPGITDLALTQANALLNYSLLRGFDLFHLSATCDIRDDLVNTLLHVCAANGPLQNRAVSLYIFCDDPSVAQAGKDRLKAKIGDAQLAANAMPGAAAEVAPAASAAVGSALESGMASGVAAAPDAEHVDDAGTPHRTMKVEVRYRLRTHIS